MSRLTSMSAEAIRAIFSPEADTDILLLLTIYNEDETSVRLRLADGFTQRLSETADEVIYGVVSNSQEFTFIPMEITLPSEEEAQAPRCSVTLQDVTRLLVPTIRTITYQPKVRLDIVLSKSPSTIEVSFTDFYISNFTYSASQVVAELSMVDYEREGFPTHSFTPAYFPGLF